MHVVIKAVRAKFGRRRRLTASYPLIKRWFCGEWNGLLVALHCNPGRRRRRRRFEQRDNVQGRR